MWRSSIFNFTQIGLLKWEKGIEIHLCPSVKCDRNCANFHETSQVLIDFLRRTHMPKRHENLKIDSVAVPGQGRLIYTYTPFPVFVKNAYYFLIILSRRTSLVEWVVLMLRIREFTGSNLNSTAVYPEFFHLKFFQINSGKLP